MNGPLAAVLALIAVAAIGAWCSGRATRRIARTATQPGSLRQPCDELELEDLGQELDTAALVLADLYPTAERTET